MPFQISRRLPWAIALGALALWAFAPGGWGRTVLAGAPLYAEHDAAGVSGPGGEHRTGATGVAPECDPAATATAPVLPDAAASAPLIPVPAPAAPPVLDAPPAAVTFRLCAGADAQVARAIEGFVGGRAFSATLAGALDGCPELTVSASGRPATSGRQSTNLTVGGGRGVSVRIVSENGSTRADIAPAS